MSGRNNIYETENVKSVNRRDSGFTLIETVIALLVLTIGLLGMAALSISVMQGNKSSNRISTATALAQDKMEEFRGLGSAALMENDPAGTENYGSIRIKEDEPPPEEFYPYKRVVETEDNTYYDGSGNIVTITKTVTVRVHWNPQDDTRNYVETKMLFSR